MIRLASRDEERPTILPEIPPPPEEKTPFQEWLEFLF